MLLIGLKSESTQYSIDSEYGTGGGITSSTTVDVLREGTKLELDEYIEELKVNLVMSNKMSEDLESKQDEFSFTIDYSYSIDEESKIYEKIHKLGTLGRYDKVIMIAGGVVFEK